MSRKQILLSSLGIINGAGLPDFSATLFYINYSIYISVKGAGVLCFGFVLFCFRLGQVNIDILLSEKVPLRFIVQLL